jgi:threonine dehydratase
MPETAPEAKKAAVRDYGGHIVPCAPSTGAREAAVAAVVAETAATLVHPYDDPMVIRGKAHAPRRCSRISAASTRCWRRSAAAA